MNDQITNILKKDMNLYCKYARAEAKYILSLGEKFSMIDVELDVDDKAFSKLIKLLAKEDKCLDEIFVEYLKKEISKSEKKNEKISKHTRDKKDRKNGKKFFLPSRTQRIFLFRSLIYYHI